MGTLIGILLATMIYLERAETLSFDEARLPDAQILYGNVAFRHDSAYMYCDSAYFYEATNSLTAMGHVRLLQGDTISATGEVLFYNGNSQMARLRRHCRIDHQQTVLITDSCNYDRKRNVAYYFSGGRILNGEDTLTSTYGRYEPARKLATFRDSVHLQNPKFILDCDTMLYHTETQVADLVSPTRILYEGETTIHTSSGWYNTHTERSELYHRSLIEHQAGRTLTADTIHYDKASGYGEMRGNLVVVDSTHSSTLYGQLGEVWEDSQYGYATDSALLVDWSDTLACTYLHADTLFTENLPVSDTLPDSTYYRIRAHHQVRLYREDIQFVCDSMVYVGIDSIMYLYTDPVLWNQNNQVSSDSMRIYIVNGKADRLEGSGNAIAIQQSEHDTVPVYNQMTGKKMEAFIVDGEMNEVHVSGNAETIFYPEDSVGFIGMNTTQSSYVYVYLRDQTIYRVRFTSETTGTIYPMDQIPEGKDRLSPYFWAWQERPRSPQSVFLRPARTPRPKAGVVSATALDTEQNNTPAVTSKFKHK